MYWKSIIESEDFIMFVFDDKAHFDELKEIKFADIEGIVRIDGTRKPDYAQGKSDVVDIHAYKFDSKIFPKDVAMAVMDDLMNIWERNAEAIAWGRAVPKTPPGEESEEDISEGVLPVPEEWTEIGYLEVVAAPYYGPYRGKDSYGTYFDPADTNFHESDASFSSPPVSEYHPQSESAV